MIEWANLNEFKFTDTLTRTAQMRMAMQYSNLGHLHHVQLSYAVLFSTIMRIAHKLSQARFELVSMADVALGAEHPYDAGCVAKYTAQSRRRLVLVSLLSV